MAKNSGGGSTRPRGGSPGGRRGGAGSRPGQGGGGGGTGYTGGTRHKSSFATTPQQIAAVFGFILGPLTVVSSVVGYLLHGYGAM